MSGCEKKRVKSESPVVPKHHMHSKPSDALFSVLALSARHMVVALDIPQKQRLRVLSAVLFNAIALISVIAFQFFAPAAFRQPPFWNS